MGVSCKEVDEAFFQEPLGEVLDFRAEGACYASCGHLHEAARFYQAGNDVRVSQDALVSFGMGEDADHSGCPQ